MCCACRRKSDAALRSLAERYIAFLKQRPQTPAGDLCFTANRGRTHHEHRLAVVGSNSSDIRERLQSLGGAQPHAACRTGTLDRSQTSDVVFLFTGQGSQYAGMAKEL